MFYLLALICQGLFEEQGFSSLLAYLPTLAPFSTQANN
jgi:hypothetical protein